MKILFVGIELSRKDFLQDIEPTTQSAQCFFLENFTSEDLAKSHAHNLGTVLEWSDFPDAFALLDAVKPDKVVYALLDNYFHFAVFFAAKSRGIPIAYLDHGIRFEHEMDILIDIERGQLSRASRLFRRSGVKSVLALLKNSFFRQTVKKLNSKERRVALSVFLARSRQYYATFMKSHGSKILPDRIIAYSPETFSFYRRFFSIPKDWTNVTYTGVPSLDEFAKCESHPVSESSCSLLFIDQPLHEQRLVGWTKESKIAFWNQLGEILQKKGIHLYIKPHPWNSSIYNEVPMLRSEQVTILEKLNCDIINKVAFAGSFNSTLLLAFCASDSIATFCMEVHPTTINPDLSHGITKYGVATAIHSFMTLESFLNNKDENLDNKRKHLQHYKSQMLFSFDGKAKERLNQALLA